MAGYWQRAAAVAVILGGSMAIAGCAQTEPVVAPVAESALPAKFLTDPELFAPGAKVFKYRCAACHSMDANKSQFFGPHLDGLIQRKIASTPGYTFTEEVQQLSIVWTTPVLLEWLERPQQMVADMCMPFTGLPKQADREALLAYIYQASEAK